MSKELAIPEAFIPDEKLSEEMIGLLKYGKPRLSYTGQKGWLCTIEMNTNSLGASFDVRSNFDHPTPSKAVAVCRCRAENAVRTIKETE